MDNKEMKRKNAVGNAFFLLGFLQAVHEGTHIVGDFEATTEYRVITEIIGYLRSND